MSTIAFIGLGNMGGPMAANLIAGGHSVVGFDPSADALAAAVEHGVSAAESAESATAGADVVITMLPSGAIVRSVYESVLPHAATGTLFIDSSTISVDDARAVHALAVDAGMLQIDAPVSGGVKGATAGTLAFMVGGDEKSLAAAQPVLSPMAGKVVPCGGAGNGQAAKVCNNMILAVQQIAVGEAFALAEKLGLSDQALYDVVTGATGNCWALEVNCPVPGPVDTAPSANDFRPGFSTALMDKDLHLAMDAVAATAAKTPLGAHAAEMYEQFAAENGARDFSAIIETLR
ncbi:3-hydroxyisobutyrate dehydrogenase [Gordonia shandongensis]|uniref:3-hydroxyisobutyrate dehydrogenase n=1 Tax=Gordonia shandongensis TaxID=376351 RepID=UPI000406F5BD|nr:3-hydroxyisobutyrate dehydrogenase [Gordonia shandongensis]